MRVKTVRYLKLLLTGLSSIAALSACASTDMGQRQVAAVTTDKSSIAAGFQFQSEKIEDRLAKSGAAINDPALQAYLDNLVAKVAGEYTGELRVYPMEAPVFNAGILPNGGMFIYSGLLLRASSEEELLLVLGHEFGHYYENHALESRAALENARVGNMVFTIGTLGYGGLLSALSAAAELSNFSQEQELEADRIGLQKLSEIGHSPNAAIPLWENLSKEQAQSTNEKKRKRNERSAVFGTHPATSERIEALETQAKSLPAGRNSETDYRAVIRPFLQSWLEAELTQRDYGGLFTILDRLSETGEDLGVISYIKGQAYTLRGDEGDNDLAIAAYSNAGKYADAPPIVWREVGDLYQTGGQVQKAKTAFETYLQRKPNAPDRDLIAHIIKNLGE